MEVFEYLIAGLIPLIEKLISLGADIDCLDKDKNTVLHHACQHGPREIIQILVKAGCSLYKAGSKVIYQHKQTQLQNVQKMAKALYSHIN